MNQRQIVPRAINVPDLSPPDDNFTRLPTDYPITWTRLSGLPANSLERILPRIRMSRYRAAWQAASACDSSTFLVSHLPMMTAATQQFMSLLRRTAPHLAFAFNFTDLPTGIKFRYLQHNLQKVDQFAVFSEFERGLYSSFFDLPAERFLPTVWTQDVPVLTDVPAADAVDEPFLCAIGGEGRDFDMLLNAARMFAPIRLLVIARPQSLIGRSIPDNVTVMVNQPLGDVWRWASRSSGVLIPLLREDTCCGHVTLVGAKLLGVPILTTTSPATSEYVEGRASILQCRAGDTAEFAHLATRMIDERIELAAAAQAQMLAEREFHSRGKWGKYLSNFVERHFGLRGGS